MRKALFVIALVSVALLGRVDAQGLTGVFPSPPMCPTCFIAAHSDAPAVGSTITASTVIWTWAGSCFDGSAPTHVAATAAANGQAVSVNVGFGIGGARPDVTAHLQAQGCNGGNAVVAIWFPQGFPVGTTAVSVRLHIGAMYAYQNFAVGGRP